MKRTLALVVIALALVAAATNISSVAAAEAINVTSSELGVPDNDITHESIAAALKLLFGIAGAIAFIIVTLAGLKYVLSQGNPQETAAAKNTLMYALIGLIVMLVSFSLVSFVVGELDGGAAPSNTGASNTALSQDSQEMLEQLNAVPQDRATRVKEVLSRTVSYYIVPHPDDELSGWSLVQESKYPVFILMAQGEKSSYCDEYGGRGSEECKQRRVASWNQFLDNYYQVSARQSRANYDIYIGANSARLVFDAGDKDVTIEEVQQAINTARSLGLGGGLDEGYVVSSGQYYDHPDHIASRKGVESYDFPRRLARNGPLDQYSNFYAVLNDTDITSCPNGTFNQAHGWLNPPCWHVEDSDFMTNNAFVRVQPYVEF